MLPNKTGLTKKFQNVNIFQRERERKKREKVKVRVRHNDSELIIKIAGNALLPN
jgi:hypothetical protein